MNLLPNLVYTYTLIAILRMQLAKRVAVLLVRNLRIGAQRYKRLA